MKTSPKNCKNPNMLNLTQKKGFYYYLFIMIVLFISVGWTLIVAPKPVVYLIGDSTVKNGKGNGDGGLWGWGNFLSLHFDTTKIIIKNNAVGGRSSRTFQTEGRWDAVLAMLQKGDFVLIQFGHNDGGALDDTARARGTIKGIGDESKEIYNPIMKKQEIVHTYGWYMRKYIADTKAKGATPIVCSPVPRNIWKDGKIVRDSSTYTLWASQVAEKEGSLFINLNELICNQYDKLGEENVKTTMFTTKDHTHTSKEGALLNTASVAEGIKNLKECTLKNYMLPGK
jgi:rhamnogalacturonan acetylesterase